MHNTVKNLLEIENNIKDYLKEIDSNNFPKVIAVSKTFKIDNIDDLKMGTKSDLHDIKLKSINFSWEESVEPILLELLVLKDHYSVQKNSFKHSLIKSIDEKNKVKIEISTYDIQKLIIFILITDAEIIKIKSNDKRKILDFIYEK